MVADETRVGSADTAADGKVGLAARDSLFYNHVVLIAVPDIPPFD